MNLAQPEKEDKHISTSNRKAVLVMGPAAAGKTTFSKLFITMFSERENFVMVEMSDNLKKLEQEIYDSYFFNKWNDSGDAPDIDPSTYEVFGLNKSQAFDVYYEMAAFYDKNELVIHNGIRRNALQFLGTEVLRNKYGDDIHIRAVMNKIEEMDGSPNIIIGSVRFRNEIESFMNSDLFKEVYLVVVRREETLAVEEAGHVSEHEWRDWLKDSSKLSHNILHIQNNGSYDEFLIKCIETIKQII